MGMAKNMVDSLIATFILAMILLAVRGTPIGFISDAIFTPLGIILLYFLALQEMVFIRL